MTYRRLFLYLLTGSTLLFGGLWWRSAWTWDVLTSASRNHYICVESFLGTLILTVGSGDPSKINPSHSFQTLDIDTMVGPGSTGIQNSYGDFGFDWNHHLKLASGDFQWGADFPFWFLWLAFGAAAWTFCRVMERRSKGRREKMLAEEHTTIEH